jgi:TRAP-type C4-dicarboxylate transport system permease small subunit
MNLNSIAGKYLTITDKVYVAVRFVCKILLLVMILTVAYAVMGRFVLKKSPPWCEEIGILCMIWVGLLSSTLAIRDGIHVRMTIINYIFPDSVCKRLHLLSYVILFVLNIVWVRYGIEIIKLTSRAKMAATRLPQSVLYGSVAVVGAIGILMTFAWIVKGER